MRGPAGAVVEALRPAKAASLAEVREAIAFSRTCTRREAR